ncbi:ammonia channel protein, partial [Salmonella enterica subsp. enterica serovar Enteritidis]|nr:ammonia channel protein [Salmonella enterica subsp. enterica serovar Enteritidis]
MNAVITRAAFAKFSQPLVSTKSILSLLLLSPLVAHAADTPTLNAGDTAWVLIST